MGVVAAVSPLGAAILVASVIVLALVQFGAGPKHSVRMVVATIGGALGAALVIVPWLVAAVRHGDMATLTGVWGTRAASPSAADIIVGSIGPISVSYLGWGIIVAAAVPLVTARSWRMRWTVGGWVLALISWTVAVAFAQNHFFGGAGLELMLVPAALGLAISVSMGPLAFENDVTRADFGLNQILAGVGVIALFVGLVPVAIASADGRWYQPEGDFRDAMAAIDHGTNYRTLWIGDSDVLPVSGWDLNSADGLVFGLSDGLDPTVTSRYRLDGANGADQLRRAIDAALTGRTSRLGQLVAPMSIRYIVLVDRPSPQPFAATEVPLPHDAVAAMDEQLDLTQIPLGPGTQLFRTSEQWPLRSDITGLDVPAGGAPTLARQLASRSPGRRRCSAPVRGRSSTAR